VGPATYHKAKDFLFSENDALAPVVAADNKAPPCAVLLFPATQELALTDDETTVACATCGKTIELTAMPAMAKRDTVLLVISTTIDVENCLK
jgi:hypothetical protein